MTCDITKMSDEQLKKEYKDIYESIYIIDCFSANDLIYLSNIEEELHKRGYQAVCEIPKLIKKVNRFK